MGSYCVQCLQQESRAAQLENENAELKARLEEFKVYNRLRFFLSQRVTLHYSLLRIDHPPSLLADQRQSLK